MEGGQLFVPGRLCLLGEHSDWAGGYRTVAPELTPGLCLVTGTDQGVRAVAEARPDTFEMESVLPDGARPPALVLPAASEALAAAARAGGFFSYAAGVAAEVVHRHRVGGVRIRMTSADLPVAKGLSSSAATCVLVARAYSHVYRLGLSPRQEMELAYAGERRAGSACGRMDQVCAFGRRTVLLTFDGDRLDVAPVPVRGPLWLLVVDLRAGKDTRRILAELDACFPATPGETAARVRDALGPRNRALVTAARDAVAAGDGRRLGALMTEAQAVFDAQVAPACAELRAPRLHALLAHPAVRELAWGAKGVGSQGDGCAQIVTRDAEARDVLATRLEAEVGVACFALTLGG